MLHDAPEVLHAFLDHLAEALIVYLCYQIDSGAQASAWHTRVFAFIPEYMRKFAVLAKVPKP